MANCEVSDIIKCINVLLMKKESNNEESCENIDGACEKATTGIRCSCHYSRNASLDLVIKKNISCFNSHIENFRLKEIIEGQGRSIVLTECLCYGFNNDLFQTTSCSCDIIWEFVLICLKTLLALMQSLQAKEDEELSKQKKNNEVHMPSIIGVTDWETICSLIELVMSFGIFPNLFPGIGRPIKPGSNIQIVVPKSNIHSRKILIIINVLVSMMKNKALHSVILSKNGNDVIASLIQLRYCPPTKWSNVNVISQCCCVSKTNFKGCVNCSNLCKHEKKWCEVELDYMLEHAYQPYIIKELLILQRCSILNKRSSNKWFLKIIGFKLSNCMMQENGVKYVIEGILAGLNADAMNWKKYQPIGKLIAHVPSQVANAEDYYRLVTPQLLKFLEMKDSSKISQVGSSSRSSQYVMVTVACIQEMLKLNYNLSQEYIFKPLLHPLQLCFSPGVIEIHSTSITRCISAIQLMCSVELDPCEKLIKMLSGVMHPLFVIFCLHQHEKFRSTLCTLLVYLLCHMEPNDCIRWLDLFMFEQLLSEPSNNLDIHKISIVHKSMQFITTQSKQEILEKEDTVSVDDVSTDKKVSTLLFLLKDKKMENVRGEFFVGLLKQLSCLLQCGNNRTKECKEGGHSQELKEVDFKISDIQLKIQLVSVISALIDTFEYTILQNTPQTVEFMKGILDLPWEESDVGVCLDGTNSFHEETVDLVLMLISFLLKTEKLTSSDFIILNTLDSSLEKAALNHSKESSRSLANDLRVYIATRGAVSPAETSPSRSTHPREVDLSSKEAYDDALKDLTDPLLPTRGHALFQLSKLLKHRNKYAVKEYKKLLDIFETNLAHHDTYLYLAAIEGLLFLVDVLHRDVLPLLCRKFAQFRDGEQEVKFSSELRMKIGEAIVKSCRLCGEMLPLYSQLLLSALMTGVKDEDHLVRASSLSAIGDVCQVLKFSIGSITTEIVSCIAHVVSSDKSVEVRRAAIQVFALMFKGIGTRILQDVPDAVRDIYRILRNVMISDDDELTKLHASNALDLLDDVVRDTLFPKPVLEKKIQILS